MGRKRRHERGATEPRLNEILQRKATGRWVPHVTPIELAEAWAVTKQYVVNLSNEADRHLRREMAGASELRHEALAALAQIRSSALVPTLQKQSCRLCGGAGENRRGECHPCRGTGVIEFTPPPDYRNAIEAIRTMLGIADIHEARAAVNTARAAPPKIEVVYAGERAPQGSAEAAPAPAEPSAEPGAPAAAAERG